MSNQVSEATKRNWEKLGIRSVDGKLASRANKKLSTKIITPIEYFDNKKNIKIIEAIVESLLARNINIADFIYTVGISLLKQSRQLEDNLTAANKNLQEFIVTANRQIIIDPTLNAKLPDDESDLLGLLYQCSLQEGVKNVQGSYYTPKDVVKNMVNDIALLPTDKILEPCCGSMIYILNIPNIKPEQIYAIDNDPIAVMISTFNYFLRFPDAPKPNIYLDNFLAPHRELKKTKFDYIITNPPWGASTEYAGYYPELKSGETFSCFLIEAHKSLKKTGQLRFLLPESILNVKVHRDVREYLIRNTNLLSIKVYPKLFSGVTTKYIAIKADTYGTTDNVEVDIADRSWTVKKDVYRSNANYVFRLSDSVDESIIEKILEKKKYDLGRSVWALGIVTGNNKEKLLSEPGDGLERILTGKEITSYQLKEAKNYIKYDRSQLQQVAKDEIYRSSPKLVYKFISKKLTFAVDESASLFLNSANILIPHIPNMSIKTVAAFLNSELYQYLYIKLFREIKILKGNLMELPFPEIDQEVDKKIVGLVDEFLEGRLVDATINATIYDVYKLTNVEIEYIKKELHGTAN